MSAVPTTTVSRSSTRAHSSMPIWSKPRPGSSLLTGCCRSQPPRRCAPLSSGSGSRSWPRF